MITDTSGNEWTLAEAVPGGVQLLHVKTGGEVSVSTAYFERAFVVTDDIK